MFNTSKIFSFATCAALAVCFALSADGQTRKKNVRKPVDAPSSTQDVPAPEASPAPPKRNERPAADAPLAKNEDTTAAVQSQIRPAVPAYRYEFSQPDFVVSTIRIEHDESGAGTISFKKKGNDELITDPIRVSAKPA